MRNKIECAIIVKIHTYSQGMTQSYDKWLLANSDSDHWRTLATGRWRRKKHDCESSFH